MHIHLIVVMNKYVAHLFYHTPYCFGMSLFELF